MAFDEMLADRIRLILEGLNPPQLESKRMFGGIGYLVQGNMACGVHNDFLIVRVGSDRYDETLEEPGARQFDITGRPMTGWVMVASDALEDEETLGAWVELGVGFAKSLPAK